MVRADTRGGGVYSQSGTITLTNSTVTGNVAGDTGGGQRAWTREELMPRSACRDLAFGEHDQLFGSVTSGDVAEALAKKSFDLDRRKIQLHEPLKTLGEFTVPIRLHRDVTTHLKVIIEKEAVE